MRFSSYKLGGTTHIISRSERLVLSSSRPKVAAAAAVPLGSKSSSDSQ
jgi:hypothetical protein